MRIWTLTANLMTNIVVVTICYVDKAVYLQKTKKGRKGRVAVFKLWNKLARQRKLYITSGKVFRPYMY